MRGAFLLSCKYGKLAVTTEKDKKSGVQKIEGTKKQPYWSRGEGGGGRKNEADKYHFSPLAITGLRRSYGRKTS